MNIIVSLNQRLSVAHPNHHVNSGMGIGYPLGNWPDKNGYGHNFLPVDETRIQPEPSLGTDADIFSIRE
jgi:hypothetical protein